MPTFNVKSAIEAVLFASGDPVKIKKLCHVFDLPEAEVLSALTQLAAQYDHGQSGIYLALLEDSAQLCTRPVYGDYIRQTMETRKPPQLSPAALEVLSIIAYRQPVTKQYIEQVRGVDSSYTVSSLEEKGLVEDCGRLDVIGRPMLFRTTANFLRVFGISSLIDLPALPSDLNMDKLAQPDQGPSLFETAAENTKDQPENSQN